MDNKKAVKKTPAKKRASSKKSVAVKKRPSRTTAVKRRSSTKKLRRAGNSAKNRSTRPRAVSSKGKRSTTLPHLGPNEYLEKVSLTIEGPDASGDLVATEEMGGVVRVHHTVHAGAKMTPIPGKSYSDLKKLGEGTHEIEVVKTIAPETSTFRAAPPR